jgi:hypothetical protein
MVLTEELGARVLRDLAKLVVDVPDDPRDVGDRHDRRLIQHIAQIFELFEVIGAARAWFHAECLCRRPRGPPAADSLDLNPINHRRVVLAPAFSLCDAGQPPVRPLLKQVQRAAAGNVVRRRIPDFLEATEDQDRGPVRLVGHVVHLDAHSGIGAHPVDFLSDGGKPVQAIALAVEVEKDRHDIRLLATATREPPKARPAEHLPTFRPRQLVDDHAVRLYRRAAGRQDRAGRGPGKIRGAGKTPQSEGCAGPPITHFH